MYFTLISNIEPVSDQTCFENHWCCMVYGVIVVCSICGKLSYISLFYYSLVSDTLIHSITEFELTSNILLHIYTVKGHLTCLAHMVISDGPHFFLCNHCILFQKNLFVLY